MQLISTFGWSPNIHNPTSFLSWSQLIFWLVAGSLIVQSTTVSPLVITAVSMVLLLWYCHLKRYTALSITAKATGALLVVAPRLTNAEVRDMAVLCQEYTNIILGSPFAGAHGHFRTLSLYWPKVIQRMTIKKVESSSEMIFLLKKQKKWLIQELS